MEIRLDVGMGEATSSTRASITLARFGTCQAIQLGGMEKEVLEIHESQKIQIDRFVQKDG